MNAKILVVDDQPMFERLMRNLFRNQIRDNTYEFVFALNGVAALEILEENDVIDMILCDINMPEMDGLTFLSKIHEIRPRLKVVMVSAYGDMQNIRKAMNFGAYDFVPKPIQYQDLAATIEKTLKETALLKLADQANELAAKNERLQELDQLKSRFFTNISHEFRTPLTVISGMADQILENEGGAWPTNEGVSIRRNSNIILDLVNQILDLRKLESGKLNLAPVQSDVIAYLKYIIESFFHYAERKDIRLEFQSGVEKLVMDFDPEKLLRIISNLLSNAIKFTPEGGNIWIKVHPDQTRSMLEITIQDTGVGIAAEALPEIFERYFQASSAAAGAEGTGIGLALVDRFVQLMGGSIRVESMQGQGTSFMVQLPVQNKATILGAGPFTTEAVPVMSAQAYDAPFVIKAQEAASESLPRVLIVEDNPDVLTFLISCLEDYYSVLPARDGQEGIDLALDTVPDLIVSDVMMPRRDGFELCQILKTDERSSHIPIILLTAKADDESRITGLEHGADAYLVKPFSKKELLVRLKKLLDLRQELQKRYGILQSPTPAGETKFQREDLFIHKIRTAILEHISDENYGIHELCRDFAMSRTNIYLKLKALSGRSTSHFIRAVRLQKAQELLRTTTMTIAEIAFAVGFNDPSYFTRTYREEFGHIPKSDRD